MSNSVTTAVVLAAGFGRRLFPLTEELPKPLVKIAGKSILERLIENLVQVGVTKVVIVTGHMAGKIESTLRNSYRSLDFHFIENTKYSSTNNIYSLWLAREYFDKDFLLLEADVVCEVGCLATLMAADPKASACLISPKKYYMDGACVEISGSPPEITAPRQVPDKDIRPTNYKTVNFYRISSRFASNWLISHLKEKVDKGELSGYYEAAFAVAIDEKAETFLAATVPDAAWFEVDNLNDLDIAEFRFMGDLEREMNLRQRHGGYWRYPIVDHCLLYNQHYPPKKLLSHLAARLEWLLREYPSAHNKISEFASRYYEINQEYIAVSNGLSEIIPIILSSASRPVIIPTPSFNEYEAVVPAGLLHTIPLNEEENFAFDVDAIVKKIRQTGAGHLVIVSPNNPTGTVISPKDLEHMINQAASLKCEVILDLSFADFHDPKSMGSWLERVSIHPNLVILQSLSKSHGIGGIRLGVAATSNLAIINSIRERLPLWNINAFAEEYLRIFSSFRDEYFESCRIVRSETDRLKNELGKIDGLKVYPTSANFVFCRLDESLGSATELAAQLFREYGIYVKDCSGKSMKHSRQYMRIASRGASADKFLVTAVNGLISQKRRVPL